MSTLSAIASTLIKRNIPFYSFNSATPKAPPLLLSHNAITLKKPTSLTFSALLLANNDPFNSPPEFSNVPLPNHQPIPTVPLEVPEISTAPEIEYPGSTPAEVNIDPPPCSLGLVPGPEFPKPAIPPQPDTGPELPKPVIPPRPDPDIPLPKPDIVPPSPPDYVPPKRPGPEIVPPPSMPPPDMNPPSGPYVL